MDENLKFALTLGAGAVGGAFVAGLFAFIGAWIADKREHKQWLRTERLRAYETFFAETRPWAIDRWLAAEFEQTKEAQAANLQLLLIAPRKVVEAVTSLEEQITNFRIFIRASRELPADEKPAKDVLDGVVDHNVHVLEERTALVGKAMRKSLKLSKHDVDHWGIHVQRNSPSVPEMISRAKEYVDSRR